MYMVPGGWDYSVNPPSSETVLFAITFGPANDQGYYSTGGSFGAYPNGTEDDPGNGEGFFSYDPWPAAIVDFSDPIAGFGVSFMHSGPSTDPARHTFSEPATITVYDGPNGTGNVLGTVSSSGYQGVCNTACVPPPYQDFVAIWSSDLDIQSAVLSGTSSIHEFAVDGIAISFTPIPLPSAFYLFGSGLLGLVGIARRKKAV